MDIDPESVKCRSGRVLIHSIDINSSEMEYLFKIFENTTLGSLFYIERSLESPFKPLVSPPSSNM
jgi:hypothetical protein